jgi:iron transport multicopper oxidase
MVTHSIFHRSFATLLAVASLALGADVYYNFNVANHSIAPDGYSRQALLVNAQFPGTLIQANKNDVLHINVTDQIANPDMRRSTSIVSHAPVQVPGG